MTLTDPGMPRRTSCSPAGVRDDSSGSRTSGRRPARRRSSASPNRRAPLRGPFLSEPVSRILSWTAIHLCGLPGPRRAGSTVLFGLAPGGVCHARPRHRGAGALLPHPLTLTCARLTWGRAIGGLLSVALSRGFPRVDVTHRPCPVVSGLSSKTPLGDLRDCLARTSMVSGVRNRDWDTGTGEVVDPAVVAALVLADEGEVRRWPVGVVEVALHSLVLEVEEDALGAGVLAAHELALEQVAVADDQLGGEAAHPVR